MPGSLRPLCSDRWLLSSTISARCSTCSVAGGRVSRAVNLESGFNGCVYANTPARRGKHAAPASNEVSSSPPRSAVFLFSSRVDHRELMTIGSKVAVLEREVPLPHSPSPPPPFLHHFKCIDGMLDR